MQRLPHPIPSQGSKRGLAPLMERHFNVRIFDDAITENIATSLAEIPHPVPVCADESLHDRAGLDALAGRYDAINIKLDKTGGLTEALLVAAEAERLGLAVMVGCMVGTSLAMAPAVLLTPKARFVDLDGPLLLAHDRPERLLYEGSTVYPPSPALWG